MDYVKSLAINFAVNEFDYGQNPFAVQTIERAKRELSNIKSDKDRITFLSTILEKVEEYKQEHMKICRGNNCDIEDEFSAITFYLSQELFPYGISLDEDTFTSDERNEASNKINELLTKIDTLLNDNQELKNGHEILFNELQELKDLYYLGKRKWHQLAIGKFSEMVDGSIVSDTIGRTITESLKPVTKMILG